MEKGQWSQLSTFKTKPEALQTVFFVDFTQSAAEVLKRWPTNEWYPAEDVWLDNGLNVVLSPNGRYYFISRPIPVESFIARFTFEIMGYPKALPGDVSSYMNFTVYDEDWKNGIAVIYDFRQDDVVVIYEKIDENDNWVIVGSDMLPHDSILFGQRTLTFTCNRESGDVNIFLDGNNIKLIQGFNFTGDIGLYFGGENLASTTSDENLLVLYNSVIVNSISSISDTNLLQP